MAEFHVRVELADVVTTEEVRAELARDPAHRLVPFEPRLRVNELGRAEVTMTVSGADVWTVALAVMGVFAHTAVGLKALHVEGAESSDEYMAA